jgi:hypothetical protein
LRCYALYLVRSYLHFPYSCFVAIMIKTWFLGTMFCFSFLHVYFTL